MRQPSCVLYIAVDAFLPTQGKSVSGFDEFAASLEHAGIPAVWLTSRSRLQFDEPRRRLGHTHPFIAEDGCGVYLPEDYFHLRPDSSALRLGRFTCIPIAQALPATSEALEALSEDTHVPIVPLRLLSSREVAQNTGLPPREAELARQRDFDELFFFAGASQSQTELFLEAGRQRGMKFRQHEALWSAALGASIPRCIAALTKLYDRALRYHAHTVALATPDLAPSLFPSCDRSILLVSGEAEAKTEEELPYPRARRISQRFPQAWEQALEWLSPTNPRRV